MGPVWLPNAAGTAPPRHAVIFADEDVLAVKAFETRAVRIVVPSAAVTLGFNVVLVPPHLRPLGFLCGCGGLFSRYEARVTDDGEDQARIRADEEREKHEEKDQKRNGGSWAASIT